MVIPNSQTATTRDPMNGAFLRGAASGCGDSEERVLGNDTPGQCCARISPPGPGGQEPGGPGLGDLSQPPAGTARS